MILIHFFCCHPSKTIPQILLIISWILFNNPARHHHHLSTYAFHHKYVNTFYEWHIKFYSNGFFYCTPPLIVVTHEFLYIYCYISLHEFLHSRGALNYVTTCARHMYGHEILYMCHYIPWKICTCCMLNVNIFIFLQMDAITLNEIK